MLAVAIYGPFASQDFQENWPSMRLGKMEPGVNQNTIFHESILRMTTEMEFLNATWMQYGFSFWCLLLATEKVSLKFDPFKTIQLNASVGWMSHLWIYPWWTLWRNISIASLGIRVYAATHVWWANCIETSTAFKNFLETWNITSLEPLITPCQVPPRKRQSQEKTDLFHKLKYGLSWFSCRVS